MVAMKPYWFTRTLAGLTMDVGAVLGMWNMYKTIQVGKPIAAAAGSVPEPMWT
jgi:cbb3-type cytochrome oxidase subunit 1